MVSLLDPLICFCRAHGRDKQTDHAICVATGRIFTLCIAMRPCMNYGRGRPGGWAPSPGYTDGTLARLFEIDRCCEIHT